MISKSELDTKLISQINKQITSVISTMNIDLDINSIYIDDTVFEKEDKNQLVILIDCHNISNKEKTEKQIDLLDDNSEKKCAYRKLFNALNGQEYKKIDILNHNGITIHFKKLTNKDSSSLINIEDFQFKLKKIKKRNNKKNQLSLL